MNNISSNIFKLYFLLFTQFLLWINKRYFFVGRKFYLIIIMAKLILNVDLENLEKLMKLNSS